MSLEDKHIALETELIVAKDAIWGLTERVINLETEIKKLTTIILHGGDKDIITPLGQKNSRNCKSAKAPALKPSKSKGENKSVKQKRNVLEAEESQKDSFSTEENEPVVVKVETGFESPNDSCGDGEGYPNESEFRDFEDEPSSAGGTRSETKKTLKRPSRTKAKTFQRNSNESSNPISEIQPTVETDDSDSDSSQKKLKLEAKLKRGDPDPIWCHWKRISLKSEKRVVVQCVYCSSHDQLNHATKCKRHTAVCKSAPLNIKNEFSQWKDYGKSMRKMKSDEPEPT